MTWRGSLSTSWKDPIEITGVANATAIRVPRGVAAGVVAPTGGWRKARLMLFSLLFPRAKNPNNGGEGVAVLPRIPPAFPSDVSILEVSMISTRRFNSDCPATVHYFMALWAKELLVEDGFPMLQEEF